MALGALIGAYQEDDSRRPSRLASARRPNPGRISGALRRGGRRGADRRPGRARSRRRCTRRSSGCGRRHRRSSRSATATKRPAGSRPGRADPAGRRRRRAAGRACSPSWPRSLSRRSRPCPTTKRMQASSGSTAPAAGRAWRWSTAGRWARPRRCSATGTCSRPCCGGRCRTARCGSRPTPRRASRLLADSAEQLAGFERALIASSRGARSDWASRYVLPLVEEFATERLMETPRPAGMADLRRRCS